MNVVIDTNVVVSAVIKDRNPEKVLMFVLDAPDLDWVATQEIVDEYMTVLRRKKFCLPHALIARWERTFSETIHIIRSDVKHTAFPRDPADAKFLACCLCTDARYFITGDSDFGGPLKYGNTLILSVAQFIRYVYGTNEGRSSQ